MTNEEKMDRVFGYIKENIPSAIQIFYRTISPFYRNIVLNINNCAKHQGNWRMYLVDLGGNGRHRNIRKAIRLMNNNKSVLADVINTKSKVIAECRIRETVRSPLHHWAMQMPISDKGPERGIFHDLSWFKGYNI